MAISDRIEATIDRWALKWSEGLGYWLGRVIGKGIEGFADVTGLKLSKLLAPMLEKVKAQGDIPPEMKPLFDELQNPTGEAAFSILTGIANRTAGQGLSAFIDNAAAPMVRGLNRAFPNKAVGEDLALQMMLRHPEDYSKWGIRLQEYGYSNNEIAIMWELLHPVFPSDVVGPMWLRDKEKYEKYWDDVRHLGVTEDRIELLKESMYKMPTPQAAVSWMAHEVFEPDMIEKYGLDDEWDKIDKSLFEKIGLKEDQALNYWRDHWEHPNYSQIREMRHKGLLTDEEVYNWFRLVEIPPYWRKQLTAMMWDVPGRVELRMMTQYGLVDKKFAMDILEKDGLAEEYRSIVADMMIVRGARTDIQARYTKGWIDSAGVRAEIDALGIDKGIADRMYMWIVKNVKGDRTTAEKDLTKAEIIKGVKEGIIDPGTGAEKLMGLGYDEDEAIYLLAINVDVKEAPLTDAQQMEIDNIRRSRRGRIISHEQEIQQLLSLGIDLDLATATANNDDLRLEAEPKGTTPAVIPIYETDAGKVELDTIRRSRRQGLITHDQEVTQLLTLQMSDWLAKAYADNDDLRLTKAAQEGTV